ncbi:MAG: hypothetical protein P8Z31_09080 [Gammaproteobacteria bacterium]|jgi:hypothetical protein
MSNASSRSFFNVIGVLCTAFLLTGCGSDTSESKGVQKHLTEIQELDARRSATLAEIQKMPLPQLFAKSDEDSSKLIEPYNSVAYREITRNRKDSAEQLRQYLTQQKTASYIPLLALRKIDEKAYAQIKPETKVAVLIGLLANSKSYNTWGLPHLYWEDAAEAVIELGKAAAPGLKKLLDDKTPAPVWGTEEVFEYEAYKYRRCDYALALLMAIEGEPVKDLPKSPEDRDALIANHLSES